MAEWLLIRFDPARDTETAVFMACTPGGEPRTSPRSGTLAEAAAEAAGRRVVVLLPGAEVTTLDAELPARAGSKLLQAVPYALEEQVAADVDTLHFALGARAADGRTAVCVIGKATLQGVLDTLGAAGLAPQAVYPETALVRSQPGHLVMLVDGDTVHLCPPEGRALSLPSHPLSAAVDLALQASAPPGARFSASGAGALGLRVQASPADWEAREGDIEALRSRFASLAIQQLPYGPLPWLAEHLAAGLPINLLQGAFAPRASAAPDWRRWRLAAGLALLLLVLHGGSQFSELRRLNVQEQQVDASLEQALQTVSEPGTSARDARRAIEARLLAARGPGAARDGLLPALAAFAEARSAAPDAILQGLLIESGSVELRLKAGDAASIERIGASLRAAGWQAELLGGSGTSAGYEGRIRLQSPNAAAAT